MNDFLCTESDIKKSEELHQGFEDATGKRKKAQGEIDQLQAKVEDAYQRLQAAKKSQSPRDYIDALKGTYRRLKADRDSALAAADAPLIEARDALKKHDGRFLGAAGSWLDTIRKNHDYDRELGKFILEARAELSRMQVENRPLREIADYFENVREKVESWDLAKPSTSIFSGNHYPKHMVIPRLSDWLR